jgi:hypothetical protein
MDGELTLRRAGRYAPVMPYWAAAGLLLFALSAGAEPAWAASESQAAIPVEDYDLYDQIVTKKFLTSDTRLVVLERMTVGQLMPDERVSVTVAQFDEQSYFDGELPRELVRDFVAVNQEAARLEGRFRFGARYRFVSGDAMEEPEVRAAIPAGGHAARPTQAPAVVDRLAFSRVGRTLRNDQALVFVRNFRPDGTGAGFLIWFRRQGTTWTLYDTEVIWTARLPGPEEGPLLAP